MPLSEPDRTVQVCMIGSACLHVSVFVGVGVCWGEGEADKAEGVKDGHAAVLCEALAAEVDFDECTGCVLDSHSTHVSGAMCTVQ